MAKNEVATRTERPFSVVLAEKLNSVGAAIPADLNKDRCVQNALALLNDNPGIGKYKQSQIIGGLMKGAYLGLDFFSKEAYLIPYGNQLQFQTDYKGERKLAMKYSTRPIKELYAEVVRKDDLFEEWVEDGIRHFRHTKKPFSDAEIVGAYAVCVYVDGGVAFDSMTRKALETTRSKSKAKNSMAWADFTSEMYKKTVLRRLCKQITIDFASPEATKAYQSEADMLSPEEQATQDIDEGANTDEFVVDGEAVEVSPESDGEPQQGTLPF